MSFERQCQRKALRESRMSEAQFAALRKVKLEDFSDVMQWRLRFHNRSRLQRGLAPLVASYHPRKGFRIGRGDGNKRTIDRITKAVLRVARCLS